MRGIFRDLLSGSETGQPVPSQEQPVTPSEAGEPLGAHVRLFGDRFEALGATFARRELDGEGRRRVPADLRAALQSVLTEDIDAGSLVPARDEVFLHITGTMAETLCRIAELEQNPRLRAFAMLIGPTGCGKTTMVKTYCHLANEPCVELTFSGDTTLADFFRRTEVVREESGQSTVAALGPAVRAMLLGYKLLINEINMLPPDLISALTQAMDTGRLVLSGTDLGNIEVEVHQRFGIFATANPNYVGTAEIGRALQRRFGTGIGHIPMGFLPANEEVEAVAFEFNRQPLMRSLGLEANPSIVERLVGVAGQLRAHPEFGGQMGDRISTRSLVHWLSLGRTTGLPLAEVAADAVLSIAPDDIYPEVLELTRHALGRAQTSVACPEAVQRAMLTAEAPAAGEAAAVPSPAAGDGQSPGLSGDSTLELTLRDGRQVRIAPEDGHPPRLEAFGADGTPIHDLGPVRETLREEYGLNLVHGIGHLPGPNETLPCLTRTTWRAIRLTQGALLTGRPVFLRGPTGCGKSALARTVALLWNLPVVEFSFTGETSKADLTASRRLRRGATEWTIQAFLEAAEQGLFVIINEYNLAYPDVHSIVNGLFDKGGRLMLPDGRTVRAHPDFRLVATGFPEGPGVKPLNEGVENRFGAVIRMDYPPKDEELAVLGFVADGRVAFPVLAGAAELAAISRDILAGKWEGELRHPLSKVPPDLAAAAAERTGLTTAELVALARASDSTEDFVAWHRRGVLTGAPEAVERVLTAALAGYGLV